MEKSTISAENKIRPQKRARSSSPKEKEEPAQAQHTGNFLALQDGLIKPEGLNLSRSDANKLAAEIFKDRQRLENQLSANKRKVESLRNNFNKNFFQGSNNARVSMKHAEAIMLWHYLWPIACKDAESKAAGHGSTYPITYTTNATKLAKQIGIPSSRVRGLMKELEEIGAWQLEKRANRHADQVYRLGNRKRLGGPLRVISNVPLLTFSNQKVKEYWDAEKKGVKKTKSKPEPANYPTIADFEKFWSLYPKKVNKGGAKRAWKENRQEMPPIDELLQILEKHVWYWDWGGPSVYGDGGDEYQYAPNADNWIKNERWVDEAVLEAWEDLAGWEDEEEEGEDLLEQLQAIMGELNEAIFPNNPIDYSGMSYVHLAEQIEQNAAEISPTADQLSDETKATLAKHGIEIKWGEATPEPVVEKVDEPEQEPEKIIAPVVMVKKIEKTPRPKVKKDYCPDNFIFGKDFGYDDVCDECDNRLECEEEGKAIAKRKRMEGG